MKKLILVVGMVLSFGVVADETVQMNDGSVYFKNSSGQLYGGHGGSDNGSNGFNDAQTGQRYEAIGGNRSIDTGSGQTFDRSNYGDSYNDYGDGYND